MMIWSPPYTHSCYGIVLKLLAWTYFGTWHFIKRHFGMRTFRHENISAWVYFGTMDVSAQGHFSTRIFQHMDISAHVHFGTVHSNIDISVWVPLCQNVHVPKYPCAEMSHCRNFPVPKRPWCQKIPKPKCSCVEMSLCQKFTVMKCSCRNISCWNVRCRNKPNPLKLFNCHHQ